MERRERLMATLQGEAVDRPAVCFYEINGLDEKPDNPDPYNIYSDPSWKPLLDLARDRKRLTLVGVWLLAALAVALVPVPMMRAVAQGTKDTASNGAIMKQYAELLKTSPKPVAVVAFLDKHISQLRTPDTDKMVYDLEKIQEEHVEKYSGMFSDDAWKTLDQELPSNEIRKVWVSPKRVKSVRDPKLRDQVQEILAGGITLYLTEGGPGLTVDYSFLKRYKRYVSSETAAYIDLYARETDQGYQDDRALLVSWDELAGRALQAEKFLRDYPSAVKRDRVRDMFEIYAEDYLVGLENSSGWVKNVLSSEVKASYTKTIRKNPGTALASIVQEYVGVLKKNDYALTGPVQEFRNAVPARLETLIASFGQSKPAEPSQVRTKTHDETKKTNKPTGQGDQGR